jgi:alpha-tubulin suppressor-like RCC1 family protein
MAAGFLHTCAMGQNGAVDCWGRNEFGQLGIGTTSDAHVPTAVVGFPAGATAITAGEGHSCALTTVGGARCWGRNWAGELGNGVAWRTTR